ncbi:MAG: YceI family protein [Deltaproteobacteria bacterium]|nr:YceI family protein [Deltaproteobacteria bacterium]
MKKLLLLALVTFTTTSAFAVDYTIDPDHTSVGFKVRHLGISSVTGKFAKVSGEFSYDPKDVSAAKAKAVIEANTINTENEKRDKHLRTDEFLDTSKFPQIQFVSKEIKDIKGNEFKVVGDLTIRGVTKTIVLDAEFSGATTDPWGNERAAFEAEAKLDRREFGLTWNKVLEAGGVLVGDEVKITLDVEGVKKKA